MSDATHTPRPWVFRVEREATENSSARFFIDGNAGTARGRWVIAETKALLPLATEEAEANARLIAAAPDLLAALRKVESYLGDVCDQGVLDLHPVFKLWNQVTAAIAKAEGRPQ